MKRKTTIGGQALLEGLLMVGPYETKAGFRRKNGEIEIVNLDRPKKDFWTKIPFLRGSVMLFRQLKIGTNALMLSAEKIEEDATGKKEESPKQEWVLWISALIGILGGVALFILLPHVLASFLFQTPKTELPYHQVLLYNTTEAVIRLSILVLYMSLMNLQADTKRLWQYHGAEHKTIACYEACLPLTVENVQKQSRFHPRCGTSFLFNLAFLSVLIFSLTGWHHVLLNLLFRLFMLPVLSGISYEILQWSGKYDQCLWARLLSQPGMWMQRLTTREPEDHQVEVSIAVMQAVLPDDDSDLIKS